MQDHVGQRFGNYRLVRRIGQGGYAEVYLAEHIELPDLRHAIKILTAHQLQKHQREEFLAEARIMASLQGQCEHLVQIHDFGIQSISADESQAVPYFVMEYAAAGTLRDRYPRGTSMPLDRVLFYVDQVARALHCAHQQTPPIVHRDIKPENMLLRTPDHLLLSDFGIAFVNNTVTLPHTFTGRGVVGTAAYIAPERLGGQTKRASDQYSLAVVIYEWICGFRPFQGSDGELCYQHIKTPPPPLHGLPPEIAPAIEAVLWRALAKKPGERYPDIRAFSEALASAARSARPVASAGVSLPSHTSVSDPADTTERQARQAPGPANYVPTQLPDSPALAGPRHPGQSRPPMAFVPTATPGAPWQRKERAPMAAIPAAPMGPQIPAKPFPARDQSSARSRDDFWDFSAQYATDPASRLFRLGGSALNLLAVCAGAWLSGNIWLLPCGFISTFLFLALCVRAVNEVLAISCGIVVALYWGWSGWLFASSLAAHWHLASVSMGIGGAVFFFALSAYFHVQYVLRKNT
ncbi:MAG TPA: protein kinase [Ktedonobacteraceae bacterium]|jgi:serine/threonine protein kinase